MKLILISFLILISNIANANLYLSTVFKETKNSKELITKHHLFLNIPYLIKYEKVRYMLTLKKIVNNKVTIDAEVMVPIKNKFEVVSGKVLIGSITDSMTINTPLEKYNFNLKLVFEKLANENN